MVLNEKRDNYDTLVKKRQPFQKINEQYVNIISAQNKNGGTRYGARGEQRAKNQHHC